MTESAPIEPGREPISVRRRAAGSVALLAGLAVMVLANLPVTDTNARLGTVGLEQGWDVFAPDPVSTHVELEAVVSLADGSEQTWRPPRADAVLAPAAYHWDMWTRTVLLGPSAMADATARWVADRYRARHPVRVTLRRRWFTVPPPGSSAPRRWHESDFYVLEVRP